MRKIYAFIITIVCSLTLLQAKAQNETANFTFTISGNTVHFTNTSNTPPGDTSTRRCYWQFGDGTTLFTFFSVNPYHTYPHAGTYQACLNLMKRVNPAGSPDSFVLVSSICQAIVLSTPDSCSANYTSQPGTNTQYGRYFTAVTYNNNQKRPEQICWQFGDGRDTCINYDPTAPPASYSVYHLYNQAGTYNVCLTIHYQGGCVAYYCRPLSINNPDSCTANFQVLSTNSNSLNKYFIAQPWNNNNKKPIEVCWQFGDGRDTCIQYPTTYTGAYAVFHAYAQGGNYNVCVNIHYDGGCEAHYCRVIEIPVPDSCSANFEVVQSTSNSLTKYFVAQPYNNHNKKPLQVCWNFGDGRDTCLQYSTTYTGAYSISHTYAQSGNYNVCVTIHYDGGCQSSYCKSVQVGTPDSCSANFQVLSVSSTSLGKYFIAQPWHNHNKKPVQVCWNFGDGRDTCLQYSTSYTGSYAVYHLFSQAGNYNVCVTIHYDGGCESHYCRMVLIGDPGDSCSANFEALSSTANSLTKYFIAQPWHNHNKKPVQVCWNFGDGRDTCIQYSTTFGGPYAVMHTYAQTGNYNVCVVIHYDGGCQSQNCHVVQVGEPDSCSADFERIPSPTATGLTAGFRALPYHNHNKNPHEICWQFGDGSDTCITYSETYTGAYTIYHTYAQPGQYEVCVHITYFGGCESTKCKPVVITVGPDSCGVQLFESTPSITSLTRSFYALPFSSNNRRVEQICWHFGDGRDTCIIPGSISVTPAFYISHTYPAPGVYHICVNVLFVGGCSAEKCIEVTIRNSADICGGYFTDSLIAPRTFKFHGQGIQNQNDNVTSYYWTFSDGITAAGQDVTHTFNQTANYQACLVIHTAQGCETHICRPLPSASGAPTLQLSPNPVISNLHVVFISSFNETVNIKIINSSGNIVRTYSKNVVIGSNTWDFDLSTLTPGIYSFVVQSSNQLASAIFLKQ